jgi:hypothetical protein
MIAKFTTPECNFRAALTTRAELRDPVCDTDYCFHSPHLLR